ncbi:MFS superfamily sulfate permease-like transporter [Bradyrhizobium japonicum]
MSALSEPGWTRFFPSFGWLPSYRREWLPSDAVAGITLAAYAIPVSLAYAVLAGLPPQVGVYGYMLGGIGYALLGSSRQLAIGPTSAISLMIAGTVGAHAQLRDLLRAEGLAEKTDSGQWLRSVDSVLGDDPTNAAQRSV